MNNQPSTLFTIPENFGTAYYFAIRAIELLPHSKHNQCSLLTFTRCGHYVVIDQEIVTTCPIQNSSITLINNKYDANTSFSVLILYVSSINFENINQIKREIQTLSENNNHHIALFYETSSQPLNTIKAHCLRMSDLIDFVLDDKHHFSMTELMIHFGINKYFTPQDIDVLSFRSLSQINDFISETQQSRQRINQWIGQRFYGAYMMDNIPKHSGTIQVLQPGESKHPYICVSRLNIRLDLYDCIQDAFFG